MFGSRRKLAEAKLEISELKLAHKTAMNELANLKKKPPSKPLGLATGTVADYVFSGDQLKLIESLRCVPVPEAQENMVTDYTGCRISPKHFPSIATQCGKVLQIPVPDDTILHHALEYVGLGLALRLAQSEKSVTESFVMAEIGAGNGIWSSRTALCAMAAGYKKIKIICVEADKSKYDSIKEHFDFNGLWDREGVEVQRVNDPITSDGRDVYFPRQESASDYGVACADERDQPEYRGMVFEMEQRSSIALSELLGGSEIFDFVNIDIQGAELDVVINSVAALVEKVRVMVIGTHSRFIEGNLLEVLFGSGFELHAEKPCIFRSGGKATSLCGRTVQDGEQIWVNPKLVRSK